MESTLVTELQNNEHKTCCCSQEQTIAMATIPCQKWKDTYDLCKALKEGTIFPELNKPFYCGGDEDVN